MPLPPGQRGGSSARVHPGRRGPPRSSSRRCSAACSGLPPAARAAPRHHRRRGRRAGRQAEEERPLQGLEAAGRAVPGALGTTSWSSLRWRAVVHHVGNRTGLLLCGDLDGRGESRARERRVHERRTVRRPKTSASSPAATNRCASCCASRSATTTSCCARRSAPRSRRAPSRSACVYGELAALVGADLSCCAGAGQLCCATRAAAAEQRPERDLGLLEPGEQRVDVVLKGDLVSNVALRERAPRLGRRERFAWGSFMSAPRLRNSATAMPPPHVLVP